MLRSLHTYRVISAAVATVLVFGITAPVAHFVCAAAFGAFQSEEAVHSNEATGHVPCFPAQDEAPPVSDTACCQMAAADTDQATMPATPHLPLVESVAPISIEVAAPIIELSPTSSRGPAFLTSTAPRQALLSVFLI